MPCLNNDFISRGLLTLIKITNLLQLLNLTLLNYFIRIDKNSEVSLDNIESGLKELVKMNEDVRSNRGLIIKIFLIIITAAVIYILFFIN